MLRPYRVLLGLVCGVGIEVACADRGKVRDEPERAELCAAHCSQIFGPCNPASPSMIPEGPQTEQECNDNCVADVAWVDGCRFKYAEKMICSTELSCEEFEVHQLDVLEDPCLTEENDWSSCFGGGG